MPQGVQTVNINITKTRNIKWKHFPRYWPFVRGIHRSPVNSRTKASDAELCMMFSLICAWIKGWVNNREGGDLRLHRAHYDVAQMSGTFVWRVTGMFYSFCETLSGAFIRGSRALLWFIWHVQSTRYVIDPCTTEHRYWQCHVHCILAINTSSLFCEQPFTYTTPGNLIARSRKTIHPFSQTIRSCQNSAVLGTIHPFAVQSSRLLHDLSFNWNKQSQQRTNHNQNKLKGS